MFRSNAKPRIGLQTLAIVLAVMLSPCAMADRVTLINGDVLTGEIVEHTESQLTLEHAILGSIVLPSERIQSVSLEQADGDGDSQAQPSTPDAEGDGDASPTQADQPPADAAVQEQAQANAEDNTGPLDRLLSDWDSRLTLGLNGASGNTNRQDYMLGFNTAYKEGRERWAINARWFYSTADGAQIQNEFHSDVTRDWLREDSPWFFFLRGSYRYNNNRSWESRASGFGGGGYTLAQTDHLEVSTRLGFGGSYEFGVVNEFAPEAMFGGSAVKWDLTKRAVIAGESIYFPALNDPSEFRVESSLEWRYKLDWSRGLSLKLGLENEYDSRTPAENGNNEIRYFGAVVIDF